jgi:hypothetical protein
VDRSHQSHIQPLYLELQRAQLRFHCLKLPEELAQPKAPFVVLRDHSGAGERGSYIQKAQTTSAEDDLVYLVSYIPIIQWIGYATKPRISQNY